MIRGRSAFGPAWLRAQLAATLARYPQVELCVALSGGVDSSTLLAALAGQRGRGWPHLRAVHIDHGLQAQSAAWGRHCRRFARGLAVPLTVLQAYVVRPPGSSLEAVARAARYRLLAGQLRPEEILLTAHNLDDQIETVLLQLLRGAGLPGLAAMPGVIRFADGWLARPLLTVSRADLEGWARKQGLEWIEDASNLDESLDRNYLRRRVLPTIRARWPGAPGAVARSARHAAEAQALLDGLARSDVAKAAAGAGLEAAVLRRLAPARRRNALRYWIAASGTLVPDTRRLSELAGPLLDARLDANPSVAWEGASVRRDAGILLLGARSGGAVPASAPLEWHWLRSPALALPPGCGELTLLADARGPIDLEALPATLSIRWRQGGERLRPRRGGPSRALKALLQAAHVPICDRGQLPLVFAAERLLAVADLWVDVAVQAEAASPRRGRLSWRRPEE